MKHLTFLTILFAALFVAGCNLLTPQPDEDDYQLSDSPRTQARSVKRGVSYGFSMPDVDMALLGGSTSWFYNWSSNISTQVDALATQNKMDFFPMAWTGNFNAAQIRAYKQSHPGCGYILGFNEPNLTDQCNMTPSQAATPWLSLQALAQELNMKLVSPAMNYGTLANYSDPIKWLDEFFTLVPLDKIDVIAVHCYMGGAGSVKSYIERFKKYGKPIWLTEFCAWETFISSAAAQMQYMSETITYLEASPDVERYAWFIPRSAGSVDSYPYMQLLTKTQPYDLTSVGKVFTQMTTLDKKVYALADQRIEAEHFTSCRTEELLTNGGSWETPVHFSPSSEADDATLQISDFKTGQWLEYQIELTAKATYLLQIRHANYYDVTLALSVDGTTVNELQLPKTGDFAVWNTSSFPVVLTEGKHVLRLLSKKGTLSMNWLLVTKST
ncbi:MAG: carbohydrate-binding protein [Prevotellaceae bacterium]|jgi:hypothetical protein|nr:carbohydrate-binding protein [Prevotellaceae bacterium]